MTSLYWGTKANAFACSLRHSFHFDMYLRDWSVVLLTLFSLESISFFFFSAAMEKMTTQWHRQPHFSTSKGISIFVRSALPFFFVHSWTRKCPDIYIVPFLFSSLWDKTLYYDHQHSDVAAVRPL